MTSHQYFSVNDEGRYAIYFGDPETGGGRYVMTLKHERAARDIVGTLNENRDRRAEALGAQAWAAVIGGGGQQPLPRQGGN
jgi:hypothetical protein